MISKGCPIESRQIPGSSAALAVDQVLVAADLLQFGKCGTWTVSESAGIGRPRRAHCRSGVV
ncbi:hypothetical protein [Rhodococcus erythropolis]|uniref:Uncharacterized protein n=1 Tax=Rhodococcus erythropolis TaxID=1833 RepID=A0AAX3ZZZ1_RHOER|nr:hypothetical protein [Rhodococcus erythropolis]WMN01892.1 hypothetical protein QIE55_31830 [Rhodococcus erythropolis]WMN03178.1 hypothetical protein QIE55_32775 [Rhodococcus erythropolis]